MDLYLFINSCVLFVDMVFFLLVAESECYNAIILFSNSSLRRQNPKSQQNPLAVYMEPHFFKPSLISPKSPVLTAHIGLFPTRTSCSPPQSLFNSTAKSGYVPLRLGFHKGKPFIGLLRCGVIVGSNGNDGNSGSWGAGGGGDDSGAHDGSLFSWYFCFSIFLLPMFLYVFSIYLYIIHNGPSNWDNTMKKSQNHLKLFWSNVQNLQSFQVLEIASKTSDFYKIFDICTSQSCWRLDLSGNLVIFVCHFII